ncbi:hypothetical protein, partial [Escherichia coli]|uniref:hypothetical protein n=1 Tax=Escherichia coli TaxID=562 RepID=UPI001BDB7557
DVRLSLNKKNFPALKYSFKGFLKKYKNRNNTIDTIRTHNKITQANLQLFLNISFTQSPILPPL